MNSRFSLSYIDYLFGMVVILFAMFFISFMQINELAKGNILDKSEFFIEMSWEDGSGTDMDLWMENPAEQIVWYNAKDQGLMTIDRDQTGGNQNTVSLETGKKIVDVKRREVGNIRSYIQGKYTVNAVYFSGNGNPAKVKIKVVKLNPYVEVYEGEKMIDARSEATFVTFMVDDKGNVISINTTERVKLVDKYRFQGYRNTIP